MTVFVNYSPAKVVSANSSEDERAIRGGLVYTAMLAMHLCSVLLETDIIIPHQTLSSLELSALYQAASVFLFPSYYEGWGMVVGEALASGTPCVISDIPVFRECFTGGALMVNPNKVEEMVAGVEKMLSRPGLKKLYCQQGRQMMQPRTWKTVAAETLAVYTRYAKTPQRQRVRV